MISPYIFLILPGGVTQPPGDRGGSARAESLQRSRNLVSRAHIF